MTAPIDPSAIAAECSPVSPQDFVDALLRTGFSVEAYRDAYADLASLGLNATDLLAHFLRHGLNERRSAPVAVDSHALTALARLPLRDADLKARLLSSLGTQLVHNAPDRFAPEIAARWPVLRTLTNQGARPFVIVGDSHSNQYRLMDARDGAWLLPLHILCTGGSARGLGNPTSHSGYGARLRHAAQCIDALPGTRDLPFLLLFGQVDIEFVYHFQRVRDGKRHLSLDDYRAFCDATLERYLAFLTKLFGPQDRSRVFLVSVFPPALSDAAWREGYVNDDIADREAALPLAELAAGIRLLEIADLRRRTDIHAQFNAGLRAACRRLGFRFVDNFTPFLGPDGLVDPRFVVPDTKGAEHHLDGRTTCDVVATLIWHCIDAMGTPRDLRTG
ncbi:MAG TPA: hypothetical protein VMB34_33265 [Acetobacteraceae bacterium]|nr:hypothetical protein [Acetobacteraceae bacterium]